MATETEQSIRANGLEIYYRESGQGPPLVLLHGGTLTSGSWASHLPIFAERFRVLAPDCRGHGKTRNPAGHLSYRQMADDIAAFIEALGLEKPMVLGYSDGGQIALELGLHYPELTRALVVGGASFKFGPSWFETLKSWGFEGAGSVDVDLMQRSDPDWVAYLKIEHARSGDPDYWQSLLQQISGMWYSVQDYSEDQLATISTPTLLFLGDRDELNDVEQNVAAYRQIPHAELAIMPNADHATAGEELSNGIVLGFLERHRPETG